MYRELHKKTFIRTFIFKMRELFYLSSNTLNIFQVKFCYKDNDEAVWHFVLGHVVEDRLKSRFQITLQKNTQTFDLGVGKLW
jgi:hypothetical protein